MAIFISSGTPQVSVGQSSQQSLGFLNQAAQSSAQARNLVNQANQMMFTGLRVNNASQEDLGIASRLASAATGLTGMATRAPGQSRISDPAPDDGGIMAAQQRMLSRMQTGNSLALDSANQGSILNLLG